MRIKGISVNLITGSKIFRKHKVTIHEIKWILLYDEPIFHRSRKWRYVAFGFIGKYLTVVFLLQGKNAKIITAYQSSKWQIKNYKARR